MYIYITMPREKSDSLFQLVKSLTKNEKRYVKLQAARNAGNKETKTIKLLDTLINQEVFNDEEVLRFNNDFNPFQLSNLKAELYKLILQSLRLYHDGKIVDVKIRQLIDYSQLLYTRCLYHQSYDQLKKAKKLAKKHDNLELMLEISRMEKSITPYVIDSHNQQRVNKIVAEVIEINDRINLINKITNLDAKLNSLYKKVGFIRDKRDHEAVEKYLNKNLPSYNYEDLSYSEKIHLHNLLTGYYFFVQDFENGNTHARKLVGVFEDNPSLILTKSDIYIQSLNKLAISESKLGKFQNFVNAVSKIQELPSFPGIMINEDVKSKILKYFYLHEINKFFMLGDFEKGVETIDQIKGLDDFLDRLDQHSAIIFYYKIACLHFGNSNFSQSIVWLNKIINLTDVDIRRDIHCFARILNLVAHYELENMDVIDYYIRSTYRFLAKKYDLRLYQKYILNFLKKLDKSQTEEDLRYEFSELKQNLNTLKDRPYERRAFIYFDIISWLESKIERRTIGEVIRQKSRGSLDLNSVNI